MHLTINQWLRDLWHSRPELFHHTRVLDIGAHSGLCGSAASLFADCYYTGLDARPGPNVDVVCLAHQYQPEQLYDVVICCSTLEHDPFWAQTVTHIPSLLKPGGTLIMTFPTIGWPEHEVECAPLPNYYRNIDTDEIFNLLKGSFMRIDIRVGDREAFLLALDRKA